MKQAKKSPNANVIAESLDDALKKCKVDTAEWEVEKYNIKSRADGFGHEIYLKAKGSTQEHGWFKAFLVDVARYRKVTPLAKHESDELLYEVSIPDLHLSKLCWGPETGHGDYDTDIACARYQAAVEDLVGRLGGLKPRLLIPVGNDFFNADTPENTTTAGTRQDVDTRWQKSFRKGCALLTGILERLSKTYQIDVVICPGNHDTSRSWYLGEYLIAWFRGNPNVTIDNSPVQRKYFEFGLNLIMFTHGNEEKHTDLPLIMATERPVEWGRTKWRFVRHGHFHQESVKEMLGTKIGGSSALCPPDSWHASKGYVGNVEGAQGYLYHLQKGLLTTHYHTVDGTE